MSNYINVLLWVFLIAAFTPWRRLRLTWRLKHDAGLAYTWSRAWRSSGRWSALS